MKASCLFLRRPEVEEIEHVFGVPDSGNPGLPRPLRSGSDEAVVARARHETDAASVAATCEPLIVRASVRRTAGTKRSRRQWFFEVAVQGRGHFHSVDGVADLMTARIDGHAMEYPRPTWAADERSVLGGGD